MAKDIGNSPSLDTGWPICSISTGFRGLIENAEIVFEPAYGLTSTDRKDV